MRRRTTKGDHRRREAAEALLRSEIRAQRERLGSPQSHVVVAVPAPQFVRRECRLAPATVTAQVVVSKVTEHSFYWAMQPTAKVAVLDIRLVQVKPAAK